MKNYLISHDKTHYKSRKEKGVRYCTIREVSGSEVIATCDCLGFFFHGHCWHSDRLLQTN